MADIDSSLPVKTESDVDERLQSKIVDYTTPSQGMEVDSDGDAHVKAKLRDDAGAAFGTEANPVRTLEGDEPGDKIIDYQTTASVAKNSTTNHDYTVTAAKTFKAKHLVVSASGEFKAELQLEDSPAAGTYTTKYTMFAQASRPYIQLELDKLLEQVATANVRVAITNRDSSQDVYSTLSGIEA
jgi:hypothetical protein